jgi:hypothetical protein
MTDCYHLFKTGFSIKIISHLPKTKTSYLTIKITAIRTIFQPGETNYHLMFVRGIYERLN